MAERITENEVRAAGSLPSPDLRANSVDARYIGEIDNPIQQFSEVVTQIIAQNDVTNTGVAPGTDPIPGRPAYWMHQVTQVEARSLVVRRPQFEWIDMLINEVFPFDISYNSIGATRFSTDVTVVDSGEDQRNSRWTQPLMEYDVAYGVRTMEQLQGLIAFFRAMQGRKYSFLYLDHVDYASSQAVREEARSVPPTTWTDQVIGTGDGSTVSFQLVKRYKTPGLSLEQVRPIYKPQPDTIEIGLDGNKVLHWTCDPMTGIVTFNSPLTLTGLANLEMVLVTGTTRRIESPVNGIFAGFSIGDRIVTTGWVNPLNNSTESLSLIITNINANRDQITFTAPSGYGAVESLLSGGTISIHPAPRLGTQITAGFKFWVPVRFDTDRLPVSLDAYGVGSGADVKLIEVRRNSE